MRRTPLILVVAALAVGAAAVALSGPHTGFPSTGTADASSTVSAPSTAPRGIVYNQVRLALGALPIKGRAPMTGYDRAQFGVAWTDANTADEGHNGCDTRNDVLTLQLQSVVRRADNCTVISGLLTDPYTGRTITFARGVCKVGKPHPPCSDDVQIDHVVALGDAWQTGAQLLTMPQRVNLANDPDNLQATDGPTNAAKGDSDVASWVPPATGYRCTYTARIVLMKQRYSLWVTQAEHDAMARYLAVC